MQMTLDFSDELIHDFYQQVPENKRSSVIADLLKNYLENRKKPEIELPFEVLSQTRQVVTNDFINQLREQEGI
nr:hypothetical protein [uncultured Moraxella sp.]